MLQVYASRTPFPGMRTNEMDSSSPERFYRRNYPLHTLAAAGTPGDQ